MLAGNIEETHMRTRSFTPALAALLISGCAVAQGPGAGPAAGADHPDHHPPGSAATAQAPAPGTGRPGPAPEAFERQLKAMQDMHQRMQAARTPAERAALMDEHMKLMQSGMAMMGPPRGGPGDAPARAGMGMGAGPGMGMHQRMEHRMAMMEQMMQMMVDREAAMPRK
ncbi:hypothetical protein ASG30_08575 [Ramlibacter sp. Leaf400]|nr:hypothetical protein ASG30_08575 [Ramlibacter sp. Leaf400]